jgi:hypothetical protein
VLLTADQPRPQHDSCHARTVVPLGQTATQRSPTRGAASAADFPRLTAGELPPVTRHAQCACERVPEFSPSAYRHRRVGCTNACHSRSAPTLWSNTPGDRRVGCTATSLPRVTPVAAGPHRQKYRRRNIDALLVPR